MEKVTLTNMCMIFDEQTNKVLVQDRVLYWKGVAFPGGKLETGEAIIPSTIREIKEETGLDISNLQLCGIKNWYDHQKEERYLIFLLKTNTYSGTLLDRTEEGSVFWVELDKIQDYKLAEDFKETMELFLGNKYEFFYEDTQSNDPNLQWITKIY